MHDLREMWRSLLFSMAEGDIIKIQAIEGMSVFEFWPYFDRWKEKIEEKKEHLKNRKSNAR